MTISDTATETTEPPSTHRAIAERLLDGRTSAGAPAVSPNGERIAFVVSTIDLAANRTRSRVWLTFPDGEPAPVTKGDKDGGPVWSPDGRLLAFTSRRGEKDHETTLHVMPVDGPGEVRTVCAMPDGIGDVVWSPDGRLLAFTSRTRDERYEQEDDSWRAPRKIERFFTRLDNEGWIFDRPSHVRVVAADGTGTPRNLTPGPFEHSGLSWLRDSSGLVTASRRHDTWDTDLCEDLYVIGLDGTVRQLTKQTGVYASPSVSPDGTRVAFVGMDDAMADPQNARVGVIPLDDGGHRWISLGLDRNFGAYGGPGPVWFDDETVLATADDHGESHLYRLASDGSSDPQRLTSGAITVSDVDAAGGRIAMGQSAVEHPAEIVTLDGPVTNLTSRFLGWEKFAVPTTDGTGQIDAWIMRPDAFEARRKYPVLLNVHGGPFTQYGETFFDEAQMQAAAGFVVLMSNPRGSSGGDSSWGQAIRGIQHPVDPGTGWGSVDVDDVLGVLDTALERYRFCDRNRVGMLGGSYGGYMATMLAGRHGDRFRALCSERACNNLISEEHSSDVATAFRAIHGRSHLDDPDEYARMSPIVHVRDIDVPMLLIHSENDFRCPISQAEELFVALRMLGKDVTFYRFPGEGHELSRSGSPVHRRMRAEIVLDFFHERMSGPRPRRRRPSARRR